MSLSFVNLSIAVVCEHEWDMKVARDLADRMVVEMIDWLDEEYLPHIRTWRGLASNEPCLVWQNVKHEAKSHEIRIRGGFAAEESHKFDAKVARRALILLSEMEPAPSAIVLIRDGDKQSGDRYPSLVNARNHAEKDYLNGTPIVIGFAHPMKECWVLAGFEPLADSLDERTRLDDLRRELGFDPTASPEKLTAIDDTAKKNPKRVLNELCRGNREREERCWRLTELSILKTRGKETGLADYLGEIETKLVPIFEGRKRSA